MLVVTKLDRIGQSVGNLVSVAADLHERGEQADQSQANV